MNISLRWLEAFLRRPLDPKDVAHRLTMLGAPVDAIEPLHTDLSEIVNMCDRALVMYEGQVVRELSGADLTETNLVSAALNLTAPAAPIV